MKLQRDVVPHADDQDLYGGEKGKLDDVFEVTCDDPAFGPDIKAWCQETGHTLTKMTISSGDVIAIVAQK